MSDHHRRGPLLLTEERLRERLQRLGREAGDDPERLTTAFLGIDEIFGGTVRDHPQVHVQVAAALGALRRLGALGAVRAALLQGRGP